MGQANINHKWSFYLDNKEVKNLIGEYINKGLIHGEIHENNLSQAIASIQNNQTSEYLVIQLDNSVDVIKKIENLSLSCSENTHLICIGDPNDINLYRNLINIGVDDYLHLPLDMHQLVNSLVKVSNGDDKDTIISKDKPIISIVGSRGGLGTSTLAGNLGWILAEHFHSKTCLLDMDILSGTSALLFNQNPNQGLTQAIANSSRIDNVFLQRLVIKASENLDLLCAEQGLNHLIDISKEDLVDLTRFISSIYDFTVVDINHNNPYTNTILSLSKEIFIIIDFSISSIRDANKLIKSIFAQSPMAKLSVIAIKDKNTKSVDITSPQIEEGIGEKIKYYIQYDKKAALNALNVGNIISESHPNHPISSKIFEIASSITNSSVITPKKGLLEKLMTWRS